ncbi:MAG: rhodanese-like domain-containing protein [Hyphomicrobiales bacterium]
MAQEITLGYKQLCDEANAQVTSTDVTEVISQLQDDNVVLVDIRDIRELNRDGRVPGALHAPRGMLEFWIDPASPYHKDIFSQDKTFVFMCAGGMRSLLATKTAQDMGLKPSVNLSGGFGAWKKAGGPIEIQD